MEYCPHCMRPTTGEKCTHCGGQVHWQAPTTQLPVGSLLRGSNSHVYQIGAAKGQGGFGITYAAMDLVNSHRVAIKEYYPSRCALRDHSFNVMASTGQQESFDNGLHSFLEEARMLSAVGALPSVVSVRDYFEANGTAYLVMEYVEGLALHEVVGQQGRMTEEQLLPILKPLLRDLGTLHRAGVIHRDISPDNLILTKNGRLKLLDFGSARSVQNGKSMTVMLKAGFSPVEQYQSKGQGPYTDVYALAGTIYYCLTGKIPATAIDRITEDELEAPNQQGAQLTAQQEEALLWGLTVQPGDRPQNMEDFAEALFPGEGFGGDTSGMPGKNGTATGKKKGSGSQEIPKSRHIPASQKMKTAQKPKTAQKVGASQKMKTAQKATTSQKIGVSRMAETSHRDASTSGGQEKPGKKRKLAGLIGGAVAVVAAAAVLLVFLFSGGTSGEGYNYKVSDGNAYIVGFEGRGKALSIPVSIDGYKVTGIREEAFAGKRSITSIVIPESVTTIEAGAFKNCTALEMVTVQGKSITIHSSAFQGCDNLRCILVPDEKTFDRVEGCSALKGMDDVAVCYLGQIFLDSPVQSVQVFGGVAFAITEERQAVALLVPSDMVENEVPGSVGGMRVFNAEGERIGANVGTTPEGFVYELVDERVIIAGYTGDESIVSVPLEINGYAVFEIAEDAFAGNTTIQSCVLPRNIQQIHSGAFAGCSNLRDIYAPDKVQTSASAFSGCTSLRCLVVEDGVGEGWKLPAGCVVISCSVDTGVGRVDYVEVLDNGVIYGITTEKVAVLMDVPAGIRELKIPERILGYPVTWTSINALNNAEKRITIEMASQMGFPFELWGRAEWLNKYFGDFSHSWVLSCSLCESINDMRPEDAPDIVPDRAMAQACLIRAEELNESNTQTRPDGSKGDSVLEECGINWRSSRSSRSTLSTADDEKYEEDFDRLLDDIALDFVEPDQNGDYHVILGSAMYHNESREMIYCMTIGVFS